MRSKWETEKDYLEKSILEDGKSYEELGREYGCSGSNIKKVAIRLGIQIPQRRKINPCEKFDQSARKIIKYCPNCGKEISGNNKYCSNECQKEYEHKQKYQKILDGDESIMRANYCPSIFRNDILKEQGGVCAICGIKPEWNGKELIFIVDHIDGHAANNHRSNLRCICPNCDSQLDTYKSKNKSSDRIYRYATKEGGQDG